MAKDLEERKKLFLEKATKKFGNRFKYDLNSFVNNGVDIEIEDTKTHTKFMSSPRNHLRTKDGIPDIRFRQKNKLDMPFEEFKSRVEKLFKNELEIIGEYKGLFYPIEVKCLKHNIISTPIAKSLLKGTNGCPECYKEKLSNSSRTKKIDWKTDESAVNQLKALIDAGYAFKTIGKIFKISGHQIGVVAKRLGFQKPDPDNIIPLKDSSLLKFEDRTLKKEQDYLQLKNKYDRNSLRKLLVDNSEKTLPKILSTEFSVISRLMKEYNLDYATILEEERYKKHKELSTKIELLVNQGLSNFSIENILGISQLLVNTIENEFNIDPIKTPERVNVFIKEEIEEYIRDGLNDVEIAQTYYFGENACHSLRSFMKANNIINPNNKNIISYGNEYVKRWLSENNISNFDRELRITPDKISGKTGYGIYVDFYVIYNNTTYWIEFNGEQHYNYVRRFHIVKDKSVDPLDKFNKQLKRDIEERIYCLKNNITLIEIPYTYNTYKLVEEFLNKVLIEKIDPASFVDYRNLYKLDNTGLNLEDLYLPS